MVDIIELQQQIKEFDKQFEVFVKGNFNDKQKEKLGMRSNHMNHADAVVTIGDVTIHGTNEECRIEIDMPSPILMPTIDEKICCRERNYLVSATRLMPVPKIKNVIFNPPATIVFWKDGTKTVVKAANEEFDAEKGLAMAVTKKCFGNNYEYFKQVKKWTDKYEG